MGTAMAVPARLEIAPGLGPKRINTDRRLIAGTDQPWLYGSSIVGLHRLHLDLQYYKPGGLCLSVGTTAPVIDGQLRDACWDGFGGAAASREATIFMRHDAENLYVGWAPIEGSKTKPAAVTFGDARGHLLVSVAVSGAKLEVKRFDVPESDRKALTSTLPDVIGKPCDLPGASAATNSGSELAIPWRALEALGLKREALRASPNPGAFFGRKPNDVTRNFSRTSFAIQPLTSPPAAARYTVRLHFCELDAAAPGERVFDVLLNGQPAVTALDITREAGSMKALVKEVRGVPCTSSLDVELRAKSKQSENTAALLSAIEVIRE
jgi:hypothetical protein